MHRRPGRPAGHRLRAATILAAALLPLAALAAEESPPPAATGKDVLFDKVFGQRARAAKPRQIDLPVRFDGQELGVVPARLSGDPGAAQVDIVRLAELLRDVAQDTALDELRGLAGPDGFAVPAPPAPGRIEVAINAADLSVQVTVPPEVRRLVRIDVQGRSDAARGYLVRPPADLSAYVNARAAVGYLSLPGGGVQDEGRGPLTVSLEGAVNLKGWVVETDSYYREDGERRWSRGPTRLIRDFPDSGVRVQAGDLTYPVTGQQVGRPLSGLSVARNFSLQPYRSVQPAGQRDFILETPSLVEVFVNGRPTRTLRLSPGPYNLANFPGASGTNDIQIRITDQFGREQTIEFPFFFDNQLLAGGIHEFGYTVGYPYTTEGDNLAYDRDRPTFSGFHRVGLSDRLTLGAGVQADRHQQVAGAEMLLATPVGTLGVEPSVSFGTATGYAATLGYRDYRTGESFWQQRTTTAQISWRDSAYGSFGTLDPDNDIALDAAFRFSQPLAPDLTATLGGRWRENREPERVDGYAMDLTLRRRLGRTASWDLTFSHDRDTDGERETGAYLSLRFSLDEGRHTAGASFDTVRREKRLDWRYQSLEPVDQLSLALDATDAPGSDRLQGSAGYVHQRFSAGVRHDVVERTTGGTENRTQMNLATALAYADGHVALSRPISNSFALVVPHPRLAGRTVGVDPVNGSYLARTDGLGPPVVPNISAYLVRPLLLDVPEVPLGYDIGEDRPAVQPGYRTGTVVPVGTDATVSLDGTLTGPDGQPVSLVSGVLRPVGGPERREIQFFANRRGRFRVESVQPGRWELVLVGVEARPVPVEVPADAEGVLPLGEVRLQP